MPDIPRPSPFENLIPVHNRDAHFVAASYGLVRGGDRILQDEVGPGDDPQEKPDMSRLAVPVVLVPVVGVGLRRDKSLSTLLMMRYGDIVTTREAALELRGFFLGIFEREDDLDLLAEGLTPAQVALREFAKEMALYPSSDDPPVPLRENTDNGAVTAILQALASSPMKQRAG